MANKSKKKQTPQADSVRSNSAKPTETQRGTTPKISTPYDSDGPPDIIEEIPAERQQNNSGAATEPIDAVTEKQLLIAQLATIKREKRIASGFLDAQQGRDQYQSTSRVRSCSELSSDSGGALTAKCLGLNKGKKLVNPPKDYYGKSYGEFISFTQVLEQVFNVHPRSYRHDYQRILYARSYL
ncbi:MAG: hypothetical protein M1829_001130 [Trizodia sp. TS-e1964]|nr:MAG: hypothetical protein M1829_001130 [Trizodia sp. TS-e1964]